MRLATILAIAIGDVAGITVLFVVVLYGHIGLLHSQRGHQDGG